LGTRPDPREFGPWPQAYNGAASWILALRIAKELGIVMSAESSGRRVEGPSALPESSNPKGLPVTG